MAMKRSGYMRVFAIACVVAALSPACAPKEDLPPGGPLGPGTKTVLCKVEPVSLVAVDGTMCTVRPTRFGEIEVGDPVSCDWQRGPGCPAP